MSWLSHAVRSAVSHIKNDVIKPIASVIVPEKLQDAVVQVVAPPQIVKPVAKAIKTVINEPLDFVGAAGLGVANTQAALLLKPKEALIAGAVGQSFLAASSTAAGTAATEAALPVATAAPVVAPAVSATTAASLASQALNESAKFVVNTVVADQVAKAKAEDIPLETVAPVNTIAPVNTGVKEKTLLEKLATPAVIVGGITVLITALK